MRYCSAVIVSALMLCATGDCSQGTSSPQIQTHRSADEIKRDNDRMKAMNKDRALRIKRDTDKLLTLATELKEYVDKTNENVMSVDVIRKAEEVEKLAKNIREKMKEDYRAPDDQIHP